MISDSKLNILHYYSINPLSLSKVKITIWHVALTKSSESVAAQVVVVVHTVIRVHVYAKWLTVIAIRLKRQNV